MQKIIAAIIVIVAVVAGFFYFSKKSSAPTNDTPAAPSASQVTDGSRPEQAANVVEITAEGFQPNIVSVKAGDTVTWTNKDSVQHWVASGPHPAHSAYDGTELNAHCAAGATPSFDACKPIEPGGSYSFVFTKVGTWKYHDHLIPAAPFFGTVNVE